MTDRPTSVVPVHKKMWEQMWEERQELKKTLEYQKLVGDAEFQKMIEIRQKLESVQDKLKEFLKDLESSPQQVSFEKEVLVKFISEMIEESK